MIETILRDYLVERADIECPVYLDIPDKPASEYVSIQKMDAGKSNQIKAATFSIKASSTSKLKTAELSEVVKEAMEELGAGGLVFSVEMGGESDDTDTTKKKYRYETIWNIFF